MSRAELHNINMSIPENFLNYDELNNIGIRKILKNGSEIISLAPSYLFLEHTKITIFMLFPLLQLLLLSIGTGFWLHGTNKVFFTYQILQKLVY